MASEKRGLHRRMCITRDLLGTYRHARQNRPGRCRRKWFPLLSTSAEEHASHKNVKQRREPNRKKPRALAQIKFPILISFPKHRKLRGFGRLYHGTTYEYSNVSGAPIPCPHYRDSIVSDSPSRTKNRRRRPNPALELVPASGRPVERYICVD